MRLSVLNRLRYLILQELVRYPLYLPFFISIGICLFFGLESDPSPLLIYAFGGVGIIFGIGLFYYRLNHIGLAVLALALGLYCSQLRVEFAKHEVLAQPMDDVFVEGVVYNIIDKEKTGKLVLSDVMYGEDYTQLKKFSSLLQVAIRMPTNNFQIGDKVMLYANIMPPPKPVVPNGFNYGFYAYFRNIGAIGVAVSNPEILNSENKASIIQSIRQSIKDKLFAVMDKQAASVAAALIIGDTKSISDKDFTAIRTSGIAHIIAISGLHIVTIVTLVFFASRFLLGSIPRIASRYDLKKLAAICSIIMSLGYLLISGMPVSAQRAFMMSTIVMIAIIIDRNPDAMRSLTIAGTLILLFTPENLFSPSFQMSFAACYGLIAAYVFSSQVLSFLDSFGKFAKYGRYFLSLILASLVAAAITTPFVIYHFNQFSTYSLFSNIMVIPLTDFLIMPSAALATLLMPFGFEYLPLKLMEIGINLMIRLAYFISSLPSSSLHIPSFSHIGIGLMSIALFLLCVMCTRLRLAALLLIIFPLYELYKYERPDIILDAKGKLFAIWNQDHYEFSSLIAARFMRKAWQQHYGITEALSFKKAGFGICDYGKCEIAKYDKKILILVKENKDLHYNCSNYDYIVNLANEDIACESDLDLIKLGRYGTTTISIRSEGIVRQIMSDCLNNRIWNN